MDSQSDSTSRPVSLNITMDVFHRLLRPAAAAAAVSNSDSSDNAILRTGLHSSQSSSKRHVVSNIDPSEIKALEYATIRVPYEVVNKRYRLVQKAIDRDLHRVNTSADELLSTLKSSNWLHASVQTEQLIQHLKSMKRKVGEVVDEEANTLKCCRRRLEHLKNFDASNSDGTNRDAMLADHFHRTRVNRLLVDYLLRIGYYDAAHTLATQADIIDLSNAEIFLSAKEIEESLSKHDTQLCLQWCQDNKSKLKRVQSSLEFHLRQQEVIMMFKKGDCRNAVAHVRNYLVKGNEDVPNVEAMVQKTMGLFMARIKRPPPATAESEASHASSSTLTLSSIERYRDLLSESRWDKLIVEFRQNLLQIYQLNEPCAFVTALKAGLAAFKTTSCFSPNACDKVAGCPVCDIHLNALAETVPFSHCSNSRLVCGLSGELINEENSALMLPNGNVYGERALVRMAGASADGRTIVCPRTGTNYKFGELQRVYVM